MFELAEAPGRTSLGLLEGDEMVDACKGSLVSSNSVQLRALNASHITKGMR